LVAHLFDERNEGVKRMVKMAIATAKRTVAKSVCGQAPSDYPEFAQFLVELGLTLSEPDSVLKTLCSRSRRRK